MRLYLSCDDTLVRSDNKQDHQKCHRRALFSLEDSERNLQATNKTAFQKENIQTIIDEWKKLWFKNASETARLAQKNITLQAIMQLQHISLNL